MKVGITYDLRDEYILRGYDYEAAAEFDKPETIDEIENCLRRLGFETDRIGNISMLVSRLAEGVRWDLVFNIAEGANSLSREAHVPALLEAFNIPYTFSDPLVLSLALHKGMTKRLVRDLGIPTPPFAVVSDLAELQGMEMPFPLFAKPLAEGTSKGIAMLSKVSCPEQLREVCGRLIEKFSQPVLVEEYLPGREFTVGITGTGDRSAVLGVMEIIFKEGADEVYSFRNKDNYEKLVEYQLAEGPAAEQCADIALRAWRGLGCRDGGRADLRMDRRGTANFIEVNPLPGLNPFHSDLPILCTLKGMGYDQLIRMIMKSAISRFAGMEAPWL